MKVPVNPKPESAPLARSPLEIGETVQQGSGNGKPHPTWVILLLVLFCFVGTVAELSRPDRSWEAVISGIVACAAFLRIGWEWARENEEL